MKKIIEIKCQRCSSSAAFTNTKFRLLRFRKRFVYCAKCYRELRENYMNRTTIAAPVIPRGRILVHRGWMTFGMICLILATIVGIMRLL